MLLSLKKFFFFLVISLSIVSVYAQKPVSIHLSEEEGLPDIEFYDILEDNEGFIWLAADKGLYRYDGTSYRNYTTDHKRGLSVFNLKLDKQGRVWCNNISGQFFYVEKDSLKLFIDLKDKVNHLLPRFIIRNEEVEVATDIGIYSINKKTRKITERKRPDFDNQKTPVYDLFDHNSSLFYATTKVYKVDASDTKLLIANPDRNSSRFFSIQNQLFVYVQNRNVGQRKFNNKFLWYNGDMVQEISFPKELIEQRITRISTINNQLLVCTDNGVFVFNYKDQQFLFQKKLLDGVFVTNVIRDRDANYWFSTINNGLYIVPNLEISKYQFPDALSDITSMVLVYDHLIYGTKTGKVVVKNLKSKHYFSFPLLSDLEINNIVFSQQSNSILISQAFDSYIWNLSNATISTKRGFSSAKDIALAKEHSLVFSGSKQSYILNDFIPSLKTLKAQIKKPVFIPSVSTSNDYSMTLLRSKRSYSNIFTSKGYVYVSYVDGVFLSKEDHNSSKEILFNKRSIFGIDFQETSDGIVWISTFKSGVLGIVDDHVVYNYNTTNGLLSNQTSFLKADGNNLWVSTEKGLQFIDRGNDSIKNLNLLSELSLTKISSIIATKDKVYIGGSKGIVELDKQTAFKKVTAPRLYLTSIFINNEDVDLSDKYQLDYNDNIEFNFNSNGFMSNNTITYLYRLKGLDKQWKTAETNKIRFPSTPRKSFTLEIKAVNKKNLAESNLIPIKIKVTAPFWLQWWFYLILISLISLFYFYRLKRLRIKQKEAIEKEVMNKQLIQYQLENLRSQMNPHFIFNALNSIQDYILTDEQYNASMYLSDFSKLIRKYLEQSRRLEITLEEEMETLQLYLELEKARFNNALDYQVTLLKSMNTRSILVPTLFIQPYVENAIKHGLLHKKGDKQLIVSFNANEDRSELTCTIEDNGIGRKASEEINKRKEKYHQSFSTDATESRIDLLNKGQEQKIKSSILDLYDSSNNPTGTKVILKIPILK
ncbi:sensor histidine kinase [Pseudotenacibaculum haliotis]|uniref:Histidine kinase n=1 Tax=Pseudotenacibaculum haliotis TaxID=1862138 RepID=A0ABW5LMV8_9FLAO